MTKKVVVLEVIMITRNTMTLTVVGVGVIMIGLRFVTYKLMDRVL